MTSLAGPAGMELPDFAVVADGLDDVADVVGRRLALGDDVPELGGGAQRGVADGGQRGDFVGVGRQVLEQLGHRPVDVVGLDGAQAAGRGVGGRAAELGEADPDAGELLDHLGARDEGDGLGRHDDQVAQAEHEGGAGDDRPGDGGDGRDLAAASGEGGRRLAPAVEGGDAVV